MGEGTAFQAGGQDVPQACQEAGQRVSCTLASSPGVKSHREVCAVRDHGSRSPAVSWPVLDRRCPRCGQPDSPSPQTYVSKRGKGW